MRFSENWLREWVDPPVSTDELVEQLTMAGLEVDSVEPAAADFSAVVVGEVLEVSPHPDADKLRVCRVDAGTGEPLQIVCGAPNVAPGMRVPTALVGARIGADLKIRKAKLRGVESAGMLCSARELGLSEDHSGLMALPADAPVGTDVRAYLGLDDTTIEIDLTPNRGDCLGIAGIAREVGVLNRCPVNTPAIEPVAPAIDDRFPVEVQAPAVCPRYLGRVIRGVDVKAQTPLWMQEKLRRSGIRSLGPVVDVTNYVMLELGQPMHAFDLARLQEGIVVRQAAEGERMTLLDGREITLDSDTLVIADGSGVLALAGIMGGEHSGVSDETVDLFLECAFFAPDAIIGRARRYALQTDSSYRFERGVDFELQQRAMERATALLLELAGGKPGPVVEAVSADHLPRRSAIRLRRSRVARLLGVTLADHEVADILGRLGVQLTENDDGWDAVPPSFRFDLAIEADLIEEIGRIHGYGEIPESAPLGELHLGTVPEGRLPAARIKAVLVDRGYQEAITYSFVDPELQRRIDPNHAAIALSNPISSEMAVMRTSLWPGLIGALRHNLNRQQERVRLFESGLRFISQDNDIKQIETLAGILCGSRAPEQWGLATEPADFFDAKADVEALLALGDPDLGRCRFEAAVHPALHPGQSARILCDGEPVGWLGRIHPALAKTLEIPARTLLFELDMAPLQQARVPRFQAISRYPSIRRDLAVLVDADTATGAIRETVAAAAGELLQDLVIFDVYQGPGIESGRKSIALGLILQDSSRTLTEEEVEELMARVTASLNNNLGATLRE